MEDSRPQDFEAWARRDVAHLRRAARLLSRDQYDADDLAQEVMVRLFVNWDRVRKMASPEAYAHRILINEYLSLGRRLRRFRSRQHLVASQSESEDTAQHTVIETSALHLALLELGDKQRAVVVLRYYYDLPDAEIADLLSINAPTVRSQAYRALKKLQDSAHVRDT